MAPPRPARPVAAAYRAFLAARDALRLSGRDDMRSPPGELHAAIAAAQVDALRAYCHPSNWQDEKPIEALPVEIAYDLLYDLSEVARGRAPAAWSAVVAHHRTEASSLASAKDDAVRYVRAARSKVVDDPSPEETVRKAFGVTRANVYRWVREAGELSNPPSHDLQELAQTIGFLMEASGKHYSKIRKLPSR